VAVRLKVLVVTVRTVPPSFQERKALPLHRRGGADTEHIEDELADVAGGTRIHVKAGPQAVAALDEIVGMPS
jgi:hypothetical protein